MTVSVIGTGRMGKGLVKTLNPIIPGLNWGSRSIDHVQQLIKEGELKGVKGVSLDDALRADIIIHAFWFRDLIPFVQKHAQQLSGKILVDIVNPFTEDFSDFITEWGTSAAEEIQKIIPSTKVVGAFKNTFFKVFENPEHQGLTSDIYVTSDHDEAKNSVIDLLQGVPFRIMDAGKLMNNRTIERMTLFEREIAIRYGHYPYVSFRLFGQ
ncbi:NADPH-dependent F420 reductase [Paenibacillus glycanilyticus]|uniref:NADPH-dependent F420 reductase n=1 Tax=Paenibacillus glycanilyticus TaxID=126569 RepID=UPI001910B9D0|nr:NAD(P)-binding domain-containing protein [Paenibacillus glycanilyticus]